MREVPHGQSKVLIYNVKDSIQTDEIERDQLVQSVSADVMVKMHKNMVRTRLFDEKLEDMLNRGFALSEHSTLGQEAGPIGACAALKNNDYIMPYHRGWAWAIGKGMEPKRILAELLGKKDGYGHGKSGPHLGDFDLGIMGRPGVQGAHIPIAAGIGLTAKQKKTGQVCVCFFGNGSSNTGSFHEGLNLAGTWKVPVIYFCENNFYAIFSTLNETTAIEDIGLRALGYGIPGYIIDGNDAALVYHVTKLAVERAEKGLGPTLIETKTYRCRGHNPIDKIHNGGYRTVEELEIWKNRCPIKLMENDLLKYGFLNEIEIAKVYENAREEMNEAEKYAVESPYPDREDYFKDVFYEV
ncbi:MAG: transketolase [Clostridiales bacterium]|nr:transketolase [Clostridiales bacterium]